MGALSLIRSAMTRQHVPESGNTRIATGSMKDSASALAVVAKGNQQGSAAMTLAVNTIGRQSFTQSANDQLSKELGRIEGWADQQVIANMAIANAATHYARGTKAMNSSAKIIAKTKQTVAVDNATAQHEMSRDHMMASARITMKQSAYGCSGWSA